MHDFGSLVYLDVQKTGSTYVSKFLQECCILEEKKYMKHYPVSTDYSTDKFYFISVRNPFEQYPSLFQYGIDGKGGLFRAVKEAGFRELYKPDNESFNKWLKFILSEDTTVLMDRAYSKVAKRLGIGPLTYRYLVLSMAQPMRKIHAAKNVQDLEQIYKDNKIANFVVKTETMDDDLAEMSTSVVPDYFNQEKVHSFLNQKSKLNTSTKIASTNFDIAPDIKSLLEQKERLLLNIY